MMTDTRGALGQRVGARRFQRYLGVIVSAFGLAFALQALDGLIAGWPTMAGPLGGVAVALVTGSVVIGSIAGPTSFHSRSLFLYASILFFAAVAIWPFAISSPIPATPMPWLVAMLPVEAGYLAVAFRRPLAPICCAVIVSIDIALVLLLRGGLSVLDTIANALFGVAISAVLILLVATVRRGVEQADAAQQTALASYGRSRLDDATEHERTRTDALVHDSVLTTFLAAASAEDPEAERLARRMAENSLRVLNHVTRSGESGPVIAFGKALGDAVDRFDPLLPGWEVDEDALLTDLVLPVDAADAVVSSLLHLISASLFHAEGATVRSIRMTALGPDGVRIVVTDDGRACRPNDPDDERSDRFHAVADLMRAVDGRAHVRSAPGEGTAVALSWGSVVVSGTAPLPEHVEVLA
ncbi:hypothetical protein [uncultured Amnibacterium sp.]|uniref:hypothetical protein n=1 Tax=uncultured Amnibacterium sp. TaxID=1631851 RepID=UPI0035CC8F86